MNHEPGASKRLVVPLVYRNFLLSLAHKVPLAGHSVIRKTQDRLSPVFSWPGISRDTVSVGPVPFANLVLSH